MAFEEKRAWIMLVVSICAYAVYAVTVLSRSSDAPLAEVPYAATMLWSIGAAIVVTIVLNIVVSFFSESSKDQRDREISRIGEYFGRSFVVIGGVAALVLALAEVPYFWIANAVYLAFVLSAVLSSVAKIVAYREGFQTW